MAKRHRRSSSHRRRHRRGGSSSGTGTATASAPSPASYSSAASFGAAVNGSGDSQYSRVFSQNSPYPPNGNAIIGMQGQRAGSRRHRRRHSRRTYKGGFMGAISTALVPFGLIGLQQMFSRRHRK